MPWHLLRCSLVLDVLAGFLPIDDAALKDLEATAHALGMDVLVEVHNEAELARSLKLKSRLVGINNRDLRTFDTKLDISEKRLPQDGRVRYREGAIDVDLRLSTLPTVYGEKAVMRLLKKASDIPEIEDLGFAPGVFERFKEVISKPYGIFLITGPTGSGKSFTTFSILKRIATPDKNTQTIEDPVEYEIPGINQTQVNPQAGLTFARGLRSILRHDPDKIMVGEIRDPETAQIAAQAAARAMTRGGSIIMISSRTADKHRAHALEIGVNAFLGKPYHEQQLLDQISALALIRP